MKKELITIAIVLILVITLDVITSKYTNEVMNEITEYLAVTREGVKNNSEEQMQTNIKKAMEKWNREKDKLSIYIEHEELEKIEMYMTQVNTDIEIKEHNMAIEALDTCTFIIEHIQDKYKLSLENIF